MRTSRHLAPSFLQRSVLSTAISTSRRVKGQLPARQRKKKQKVISTSRDRTPFKSQLDELEAELKRRDVAIKGLTKTVEELEANKKAINKYKAGLLKRKRSQLNEEVIPKATTSSATVDDSLDRRTTTSKERSTKKIQLATERIKGSTSKAVASMLKQFVEQKALDREQRERMLQSAVAIQQLAARAVEGDSEVVKALSSKVNIIIDRLGALTESLSRQFSSSRSRSS